VLRDRTNSRPRRKPRQAARNGWRARSSASLRSAGSFVRRAARARRVPLSLTVIHPPSQHAELDEVNSRMIDREDERERRTEANCACWNAVLNTSSVTVRVVSSGPPKRS